MPPTGSCRGLLPPVSASPWTTTTGRPRRFTRRRLRAGPARPGQPLLRCSIERGKRRDVWLRRGAPQVRARMHANGRRGRASCLISSQTQTPLSNTGGGGTSIRRRASCLSPTCSCQKILVYQGQGARPPRVAERATVRVCVIADVFACFQDAATRNL